MPNGASSLARYLPVRRPLLAASFALSLAVSGVAIGSAAAQQPAPKAGATAARATPAANPAVQVVDTFMLALAGGQLENARQLMAPDAVVIANGQVLGQRDNYIDGAAKGDAAALATVQRELLRRDVRGGADTAWVLSEKRVRPLTAAAAQGPSEVVVETMLLARTTAGWKITHIHWSGRRG